MGKHESRKNKPILLVGNGINRLFANEPEDDDSFNVEKVKGEKESEECSLSEEEKSTLLAEGKTTSVWVYSIIKKISEV